MNNQEIVAKLWNLCNVLRDDGITYQQYVTELTYILFLKMCKETDTEKAIPEEYRWDKLLSKQGIELKKFYKELLEHLGENCQGRVREIYQGAQTNIDEPKNLEKIITTIDQFDWYSAKEEGLGNLYEGLLEKNATEKKSGAGQYFTPRVLINVMTRLIAPQAGERCNDPACESSQREGQQCKCENDSFHICRFLSVLVLRCLELSELLLHPFLAVFCDEGFRKSFKDILYGSF